MSLNCPLLVICRRVAGKQFHTRGPATAKLRQPSVVGLRRLRVRETAGVL